MNSSLMKKIILILALLLACAAGWYFLYWSKTPAYAAAEIQQALKKKDLQLFKERVDLDKVYSSAVDDTASYLASDGRPEHALAASLLKMLKKQAVDEMVRQTEIRFTENSEKDASGRAGKIMSASLGSAALSLTDVLDVKEKDGKALVNVKVHDKKLDKDFTWQVLMEKDVNGNWTAVKIVNLKDYLKERAG
ncbi:DUF2939 domain-containing protein [uncultured Dialister sp.]|jgi:hypothetical protein|uniref:DUF2939 domain-containing protein n=1 Tax=uncultured Dialister sp. TaxID=278064 RepID=UPI0025E74995|nr:DUF2939 domain-containing protein [uncultured Dialister sp.]